MLGMFMGENNRNLPQMTPTTPLDNANALNYSQAKAINTFDTIANTIENILGSPPIDQYTTINFNSVPLKLNGPRFGATEQKDSSNHFVLELSQELLTH
jgi:hypothetical protein